MSDLEMEVARDAGRRSSVWRRSSLVSDVELRDEKREDDDARLNVASRLRDLFLVDPADGKIVREDLPRPATPRTFGNHVQCHDTDKNEEPPAKLPRIRAASQVEVGLLAHNMRQTEEGSLFGLVRRASRVFSSRCDRGEHTAQESDANLTEVGRENSARTMDTTTASWRQPLAPQRFFAGPIMALAKGEPPKQETLETEGALHQQLVQLEGMGEYSEDVYDYLFTVQALVPSDFLARSKITAFRRSQTGTVEPSDMELLVLTSLFLAGKLDSQVTHLPSLIRNKYPLPAIRSMEKTILEATSFRLGVTTILHFMIVLVGHREDVDQTVWQLAKYIGCTETMYTLSKHTMTEYTWPYMRLCSCVLEAITNPVMKPITAFYSNKTRLSVAIFDSFKMEYLRKRASQANS